MHALFRRCCCKTVDLKRQRQKTEFVHLSTNVPFNGLVSQWLYDKKIKEIKKHRFVMY
jgi:hypothetical protein